MTHEDAGHYAAKHPAGTRPDPDLAEAVRAKCTEGAITCSAAHAIAATHGVAPAEVGRTIDLLEGRIHRCQLGLFGYAPQKRIVTPAERVSAAMAAAIEAGGHDGRLTCRVCWQIAERLDVPRMRVAEACEALGIKIRACQLGAFG